MLVFLKKYQRTILITFIALVILFGAFIAFAIYSLNTPFESDTVSPTASQYSEWVGICLPENMQNFQAYSKGWQDWLVEARFEMPASELPKFLERNKLQPSEVGSALESSYKLEWFASADKLESYKLKPLLESDASTSTGFYPEIWVDEVSPAKVIVYIKSFDT
jgi:hypothetical protein